jgi:hypothetical protein
MKYLVQAQTGKNGKYPSSKENFAKYFISWFLSIKFHFD